MLYNETNKKENIFMRIKTFFSDILFNFLLFISKAIFLILM